MSGVTTIAENLINKGLAIIPIKDKKPTVKWNEFISDRLPRSGELTFNGAIGLVCGKRINETYGIEVIDVDLKNDASGDFVERVQEKINSICPDVPSVVQRSPSGGYHHIFKCAVVEGNQVLARTKDRKALVETRGQGGYLAISPTYGYEILHGSLEDIPVISPEERELLFECYRSMNEYFEEVKPKVSNNLSSTASGLTPWEDYNRRVDVESFLQSHGWTRTGGDGKREYYRRPEKAEGHSASYNPELNLFYCFTSSTALEPSKAYSPAALYTFLECNGDFAEAAKRLRAQGFGAPLEFSSRPEINAATSRAVVAGHSSLLLFRRTKTTSMERPKKLLGPLWAQNELAFFFAEDGAGKSILAVQMGCAIATGQTIPGFQNEVAPQAVALIDAELSDYQFNTRYPEGLPENFKRFTFDEGQQKALVSADVQFVVDQIEAAANSCNSKVIILDNLSALTSMIDCTKTSDSIQLMGLLNDLKKKGFSILVIDHCRKTLKEGEFKTISKQDLQGSKMKSNLADSVFSVGKSCQGENIRYIKALKIRSYEMAYTKNAVATMQLNASPLRLDFIGINAEWEHVNDRNSEVMKMSSGGATQKEIADKFGVSQQAVSKILKS